MQTRAKHVFLPRKQILNNEIRGEVSEEKTYTPGRDAMFFHHRVCTRNVNVHPSETLKIPVGLRHRTGSSSFLFFFFFIRIQDSSLQHVGIYHKTPAEGQTKIYVTPIFSRIKYNVQSIRTNYDSKIIILLFIKNSYILFFARKQNFYDYYILYFIFLNSDKKRKQGKDISSKPIYYFWKNLTFC